MKKASLILIALMVGLGTGYSQDTSSIKEAMKKLEVMAGKWSGTGWAQQGSVRHEFDQFEDIAFRLNNTTLQIEGKGYENDSLAFHAMAIISYDTSTKNYRFNSFLADGRYTQAEGWFDEENRFNWQFETPDGGIVKYTINLDETSWHEKGAYSPKNVDQWYPFMEMKLTKTE